MLSDKKFSPIYRKYADPIWRFCYLRTQDNDLADDLTNEVFLRAWQSKSFPSSNHRAYLYRIAQNLLIDHWRKAPAPVSLDAPVGGEEDGLTLADTVEDADTPSPLDRAATNQATRAVAAAMTKIPERLKDVVILRFVEELSAKETAKILKTSEGNVRVLQHRALQELRKKVKS